MNGPREKPLPRTARACKRRRLLAVLTPVLLLVAGSSFWLFRPSLVNFVGTAGPRFTGRFGPEDPTFDGQLKVVSWNIRFGEKVDAAIEELRSVDKLADADVLLLQELDETGVEQIARALHYNYVYYPASIHRHGRSFGNAVLSIWPIRESVKIVLPHASPINQQRRIAVGARLIIDEREMMVYSVHTETPVLSGAKRDEQLDHLGQEIAADGQACAIVGGDFNTFSSGSVRALTERMDVLGLLPVTSSTQPTASKAYLRFTLDHLFVKGLDPQEAGVSPETTASDHFPIWAVVEGCGPR